MDIIRTCYITDLVRLRGTNRRKALAITGIQGVTPQTNIPRLIADIVQISAVDYHNPSSQDFLILMKLASKY
jgi:hypothetical protein